MKTLSSIEEEDITKFLEEVELMKKFCHPNIVSLLGKIRLYIYTIINYILVLD